MRSRQRAALACALLCASCREEVREINLVFGANKLRVSDGIACQVGSDFLIESVWTDPEPGGCLVLDLVPTQGTRGCRISELSPVCTEQGCTPDPEYRVRLPLKGQAQVPPGMMMQSPKAQAAAISTWLSEQLESQVVLDDAPELLAIVRATIVRSACEDVSDEPRFACSDVVGCVFSCPIDIGTFSGDVVLELDSLSECVGAIRQCASDRMFDRDVAQAMDWCDTDPMAP
jgi:hypothetical protein